MALFTAKPEAPAAPPKDERKPDVPMPVGTQKAKIVHVIPGQTSTGKVRFGIKFENDEGQTSWYNCVAPDGSNPKHTTFFYKTMEKLSLGAKYLDDPTTTPETVAEALLGMEALVSVGDEAYQGKVFRKVLSIDEALFSGA